MGILLDRDVRVMITRGAHGAANQTPVIEFPVTAGYTIDDPSNLGYSRSPAITVSNTTNRLPGTAFIDEIPPTRFSFTTYFDWKDDINVESPQELLWQSLVGSTTATSASSADLSIDFSATSLSPVPLKIWFVYGDTLTGARRYLGNAYIDSAEIDIGIESLGTIKWSGTALFSAYADSSTPTVPSPTTPIYYPLTNYIIHKYSTLELFLKSGASELDISFPLLSSSVAITNGNTYYRRVAVGRTITTNTVVPGMFQFETKLKTYTRETEGYNIGWLTTFSNLFGQYLDLYPVRFKLHLGNSKTGTPRIEINSSPTGNTIYPFTLTNPHVRPGDSLTTDLQLYHNGTTEYPKIRYIAE